MKQYQVQYTNHSDFARQLEGIKLSCHTTSYSNIIFYLSWSKDIHIELEDAIEQIERLFPDAVYYGNEASGNISEGKLTYGINVTCSIFEGKGGDVELVWVERGTALSSLQDLWDYCRSKKDLRAVELIPSISYLETLSIDGNVPGLDKDILIFGGASVNYDNATFDADIIAKGHQRTKDGMAVILYSGSGFQFDATYVLGWKGLGKDMEVTECEGKCIKEISCMPAYSVYEKYLNLSIEDSDTLVFPLILDEDGVEYIRTPQIINPDKSMLMFANIPKGSQVRIAYGDKNTILDILNERAKEIAEFSPDTIKAFSCAARRLFWGDGEISRETEILEQIAPVFGFYTGGEILRFGDRLKVLNQTLCIISLREDASTKRVEFSDLREKVTDKSLVSRLAYFIEKVSEEQRAALSMAVQEMHRNEALIQVSNASKWTYQIDADDNILTAQYSDKTREMIHNSLVEDPMSWLNLVHPDDRERAEASFMAAIHDHSGNTPYISTFRIRGKDGKYHWCKSSGKLLRREDGSSELFGMSMNLTDQIEEQERQQDQLSEALNVAKEEMRRTELLYEVSNAGQWSYVIGKDDEINTCHYSNKTKAMVNMDYSENPLTWLKHVHDDDRERVETSFFAAIHDHSENTAYDESFRMIGRDGNMTWVKSAGRLIRHNDGTSELIGITIDITDQIRQQAEQQDQLQKALDAAQSANIAKTTFLNNMSHDIRTPMNAIIGYTSMAKKYVKEQERTLDYLDKIGLAGNNLLDLINQVLDMSRIESGKVALSEESADIIDKAYEISEIFRPSAQAKNIKIKTVINNITDRKVYADVGRVNQLIMNLVGNAIKYTPEGGSIVYSITQVSSDKHGYANYLLSIKDTGIGISKEYLDKIFEPFSRESSSTVSKIQGTGLGMAIVKRLLDLMGGSIDIESEQGKGTNVLVKLSFRIVEKETDGTEEQFHSADADILNGKRVLLVEDNEMNREIATMILQEHGVIVETAEDGDIAVEKMHAVADRKDWGYYDFILMDVQMPRMNGYEATVAIRAICAPKDVHVPIIAMTANAFAEDRKMALDSGMDAHLAKPIDVNKLWSTLVKFV